MAQSYILVEAVNIYANVLDTNQLSVIRGSSFLLKQAIDHIAEEFKTQLTPISTGASSGLFLIEGSNDRNQLVKGIAKKLNEHPYYQLFTFIVESCQAEDLIQAKEQLIAQLRITQMQSLTFVPDTKDEKEASQPDQLEGRRISIKNLKRRVQSKDNNDRQLSHSVCTRLDYGRELKQSFYFKDEEIKKSLEEYRFSDHFEDLANNPAYRKLNGKIAVVYMDGNSFSNKQRTLLEKAHEQGEDLIQAQQDFDQYIQGKRSTFLHRLLQEIIKEENSRFNDAITSGENGKKIICFETLLWGGDEMLFVLPAWLGFEFIQYFFEQTKEWKVGEEALTHAAGMVFCSAKTPIRNIRNLAQSIAESVKDSKGGRDQNAWNYMVLESIDYPTDNDIAAFNEKHYGETLTQSKPDFLPASSEWQATIKDTVHKLLNDRVLPRRQLYRIVQIITHPDNNTPPSILSWEVLKSAKNDPKQTPLENQQIRLLQVSDDQNHLKEALPKIAEQLFGLDIDQPEERTWLWIHLYELWSYICPEITETKGDAS